MKLDVLAGDTDNAVIAFDEAHQLVGLSYPTSPDTEASMRADHRFDAGAVFDFDLNGDGRRHCELTKMDHPEEGWTRLHLHEC